MRNPGFVTGAPNWIDLGTPDPAEATTFYRGLFGWDLAPGSPETGGYGTYTLKGVTVAGVMTVPTDRAKPSWSVYFRTTDADDLAKTVEQAGGTVAFPPMDVLDYGRMGGFTDHAGAYFGVWQPGTNPGLGLIMEPGSLLWSELYTPDVPAATAFFRKVFGWQSEETRFPGGAYTTVRPAGGAPEAAFGGLVRMSDLPAEAGTESHWMPYFGVEDCDATLAQVERLGGRVRIGPMEMEGVGKLAHVADPYGAEFAVIRPAPMPQD